MPKSKDEEIEVVVCKKAMRVQGCGVKRGDVISLGEKLKNHMGEVVHVTRETIDKMVRHGLASHGEEGEKLMAQVEGEAKSAAEAETKTKKDGGK